MQKLIKTIYKLINITRKISVSAVIFFFFVSSSHSADVKNIIFAVPFYTPETSAGLVLNDIIIFKEKEQKYNSNINTFFMYTAKKQTVAGIMPKLYFDAGNYLFESRLIYSNFKRKFYGIGNNSSEESEEDYVKRSHGIYLGLSKKIFKDISFGLQYDFSDTTMQDLDGNGQLRFYNNDGLLSGVGATLSFDTRDSNIYPEAGCLLDFSYLLYNKNIGSDFNYSSVNVDFRNYIGLYGHEILFSYQIFAGFINGNAPVQSLCAVGGQNFLRGFYSGRYIDNIVAAVQPEIKFKISKKIDIAVFTGIGNVYKNLESIYLDKLKIASGAGIRIRTKDSPRINFRIDYALSNESKEIYFTLMEAF